MSTTTHITMTPEPIVRLEHYFQEPYNLAIATARTCYSSKVISSEDVGKDEKSRQQRDRIAESIYKAGHHTTIQHPTFQFVLEKVSRQFIWSFLHAHPFYNSEQVSQRYVEVKPENFTVPPLDEAARAIYLETCRLQMDAYHRVSELVEPAVVGEYRRLFPSRSIEDKLESRMLNRRVMPGLVDALGDAIALLPGLFVLAHILRRDHLRGITGAGRGNGEVVRLLEIVFEPDNRFRGHRDVRRRGHGRSEG